MAKYLEGMTMAGSGRKKGVLMTLGISVYCAAMLTLAVAFLEHTSDSRSAGGGLASAEVVHNAFLSVEASARGAFEKESGISVSLNGSFFVLSETLPNPSAASYKTAISGVKEFAEGYYSSGGVSIAFDKSNSSSIMPIRIEPYGIDLYHSTYGAGAIYVRPSAINFSSYIIELDVPANVSCNSSTTPGEDLSLEVIVRGASGTNCSGSWRISASGTSLYDINSGNLTVNVTGGGLSFTTLESGVILKLSIGIGDFAGKEPEVYLLDSISVSAQSQESKSARVRLL